MTQQPLAGKTALITGATGDIGRAVTESLVIRGTRVFAVDLAKSITFRRPKDRPEVTWLEGDVRNEASVLSFVGDTLASAGRIDVLINNAGVEGVLRPIVDTDLDDLAEVLSVNVVGVFLCMKHVIPNMTAGGGGSIINMASTAGLAATPNAAAYIASKRRYRPDTRCGSRVRG